MNIPELPLTGEYPSLNASWPMGMPTPMIDPSALETQLVEMERLESEIARLQYLYLMVSYHLGHLL